MVKGMPKGPKMERRSKRPAMRLKKAGVANRERFIKGCMAIIGILVLVFLAAMLYQTFFGGP
jgi:hypothetical protein